jgi:LmbE family N-acetylglucosaminyl deacetylase
MRVLAVGAHPDDIEFGCGGALLQHAARGDSILMAVMSQGAQGGDPIIRLEEQQRAAKFIGADLVVFDFPDGELGSTKRLSSKIESVVSDFTPDITYAHLAAHDMHQDHIAVNRATRIATRNVSSVLLYESPRSKMLSTGVFVDMTNFMDRKIELVNTHVSQVTRNRNMGSEAIRARATLHGVRCGVPYAEAFAALRFDFRI